MVSSTSLTLPGAYGGEDAGFAKCVAVFEEASYASAAVGISLITILQAQTLLHLFGADSLKDAVLPQFRQGLIAAGFRGARPRADPREVR